MRNTLRYLVPGLAVVALGGVIASAPNDIAASLGPHPTPPPATAAAPTPPGDGSDPLVPANTGAHPFVFVPQGDELPG